MTTTEEKRKTERIHVAMCTRCGKTIPYFGRRDLINVLDVLEGMTRKVPALEEHEQRAVRGLVEGTLEAVRGKCPCT